MIQKTAIISFIMTYAVPAILVLVIGWILVGLIVKGLKKLLEKTGKIDPMMHPFIITVVKTLLWILIIFTFLRQLGVDMTSFLTIFAACGAAVALALKDSLSNLAGGILIMMTSPFKKGDFITCSGMSGSVDSINLLHTFIITPDNQHISIPNGILTSSSIVNATKLPTRRLDTKIGVSYDCDIEKARKVMFDLAESYGKYLTDMPVTCNIVEYADSAVILELRGYVNTGDYWEGYFYMQNNLKAALDKAGIEIPFPQVDVHTK